jgi:hypothetical protein
MENKLDEIRAFLRKSLEQRKEHLENFTERYGESASEFNVAEASASNYDDAFDLGEELGEIKGEIALVEKLINMINVSD